MIETAASLVVLGFSASFGPCVAHCSLLILPHIAGTARGWKEGLRAILVFSVVRMAIYGVLGLVAGLVGRILVQELFEFERWILVGGGLVVASLGLYIVFGRTRAVQCGARSVRCGPGKSAQGAAVLGLCAGVLPCLPLLGALTYIVLHAPGPWQGGIHGLAFGTGKLISPLIPLGVLAAVAPALLVRWGRVARGFARLCGVVLFFVGMRLVIITLW